MLPKLSVLFLRGNNLMGNIPFSLGSSASLTYVILANNSLTGGIPPLLANSSSLQVLDLERNDLTGEIPPALFNSRTLSTINLARNNFWGSIPPFSHLSPLETLYLSYNNLSGSIPSSVGNSSSLKSLLLAANHMQGSIPWSISRTPNLEVLDLNDNNLSGTVLVSLYNISTLMYLALGTNALVGDIPANFGYTLPNIQTFIVQGNKLQGGIPTSMANATSLELILLRDNAFHGIIPSFGYLPNLTTLDIGKNQLEAGDWTFLSSLANSTKLVNLLLDANNLQGNLPNSIGDLPKRVQLLMLRENKIFGSIPHEIVNLKNLIDLRMEQNLLTGNLPDSLGNLSNLIVLSLSRNKLSGRVPFSIGNLRQLNELYLQENHFTGLIPRTLAHCQNLDILNLSCNSFESTIPMELFTLSTLSEVLDLSYNKLSGPIPMEIGGLINLSPLNLSNNRLTGEIPSTLGECLHLESLHLEGNLLYGRIPQSFTELRGIRDMDLSRNNLSGQIPDFFEASSMSLLNLSFNNLEGPVPTGGIFQNASKVFVQGNKELCVVSSALKLPRCHTAATKHMYASNILKIVGFSALSLVMLSCIALIFLKKRNKVKQAALPSIKGFNKMAYADLVKATNGFSFRNLVGSGKYGSVYKGRIESEEHAVAIKVFKLDQLGAVKSFLAECEALRNTRHRILVRVITVCSTIDRAGHEFKALVLEYMVNGNLESWLHPSLHEHHPERPLSLGSRIIIVVDIAAALDYLHNHCMPPMAHCDLKPSNVLLDDIMGACVGDFGLAKFLHTYISSDNHISTSLVGPRGSFGYIAPEYGFGSKISTEADVYSYGIIILEMLTGKRPTDDMFNDGLSLYKLVEESFPRNIADILDPTIFPRYGDDETGSTLDLENHQTAGTISCITELAKLGLLCAAETPKDRPAMQDVYTEVTAIKEAFSALQDWEM
uniref:Uncharacterized protein n=1 Tax=Avena sativa TaxID=4498 RepID=A0ACD6AGU5_AVESA